MATTAASEKAIRETSNSSFSSPYAALKNGMPSTCCEPSGIRVTPTAHNPSAAKTSSLNGTVMETFPKPKTIPPVAFRFEQSTSGKPTAASSVALRSAYIWSTRMLLSLLKVLPLSSWTLVSFPRLYGFTALFPRFRPRKKTQPSILNRRTLPQFDRGFDIPSDIISTPHNWQGRQAAREAATIVSAKHKRAFRIH